MRTKGCYIAVVRRVAVVLAVLIFPVSAESAPGAPDLSVIRPAGEPLAVGEVGWRELVIPLERRTRERLWPVVIGADSDGLRVLPYAELVSVKRRRARVRVAIAAEPGAVDGVARASVVLTTRAQGAQVGRSEAKFPVRLSAADPIDGEMLSLFASAHTGWLERARRMQPPSRSRSRVTAVSREERPGPGEHRAVRAFERARLEAWALQLRLRAAALSPDLALQQAAFRALARVSVEPGPLPRGTVTETLRSIRSQLQRAEVVEARRSLEALRRAGTASARELAPLLVLEGMVATVAGRRAAADVAFGQALCLDPRVDVAIRVSALAVPWREARLNRPCGSEGLSLEPPLARRRVVHGQPGLSVEGTILNDPYRLATEVLVERFGAGGGFAQEARAEVREDLSYAASFVGTREALHDPDVAHLRVTLFDGTGVPIAELGRPEPVVVRLENGEGVGGFSVPGWVWWTLGGLAVAGAATWGIIELSEDGGIERGLGPFTVDF